jgi:hypothetical protein
MTTQSQPEQQIFQKQEQAIPQNQNFQKTVIVVVIITNSLSFKYERNYSFSNHMGGGQKDLFVLKLFAQEVGETLLILILKEAWVMLRKGILYSKLFLF